MHACMHTYTLTFDSLTHTYVHVYKINVHIHVHTHTNTCTCIHKYMYMHPQIHASGYSSTRSYHAWYALDRILACKCVHAHSLSLSLSLSYTHTQNTCIFRSPSILYRVNPYVLNRIIRMYTYVHTQQHTEIGPWYRVSNRHKTRFYSYFQIQSHVANSCYLIMA